MKPGFFTASSSKAAHETSAFFSVPPLRDAPPVSARWHDSTALPVSSAVCRLVISSVTVFSPFLPRFSRGTPEASGACSPGQGLLFWRGRKISLARLIFRRSQNLEGPAQAGKQKPAVPPARRGRPQLAVPARRWGARKGE